jgi:D-alanyl-D-alanine carboxypeptidase
MFSENNRKTIQLHMFPLLLFFFLFTQAFSSGTDSIVASPDTLATSIALKKEFQLIPQYDLLSENSASEIRAGLIYDVTSNTIVWEKDMKYAYPIASLTKMMVAMLTIDEIKAGNIDWQDEIKVERSYRSNRRSTKTTVVKETYTVEGLLKMAMIPSNNEACGMLGKFIGGSVEVFVKRMNEKATALGMSQTFYSNPSGLPAGYGNLDNSSSPYDLLLLATELIKYPEILSITNIAFAEVENGHKANVYRNHNHLVMDFPGEVDGLKTGYTKNARFCLVATAKKNNHRLVAIALGASNPSLRNQIVAEMLNNYYSQIGIGPMGNQKIDPLYAKVDAKTVNAIAESPAKLFNQQIVYKTITTIERKAHVVKGGQTLTDIAVKYNCTTSELKKWNRLSNSKIHKGQRLFVQVHINKQVPVKQNLIENYDACEDDAEDCGLPNTQQAKAVKPTPVPVVAVKTAPKTVTGEPLKVIYHYVQAGDTLWGIAQKYPGSSVEQIKKLNRIVNSKDLKAGSKIKISVNG